MKKTIINFYRTKKNKEDVLITTDQGEFITLNNKEYNLLKLNQIKKNTEIYKKLEEKGIILNYNNINQIIEKQRNKKSFLMQGTSLHIIVVTLRCNLKCIYCHASSKSCEKKNMI